MSAIPHTSSGGNYAKRQNTESLIQSLQDQVSALQRAFAQSQGMTFISKDGSKTSTLETDSAGELIWNGLPITDLGLGSAAYKNTDFGYSPITADAETTFSFNHDLGDIPTACFAFVFGVNGYCYGVSSSDTDVRFQCNVALNGNYVCWLVIR